VSTGDGVGMAKMKGSLGVGAIIEDVFVGEPVAAE
jgi:hypothetical protein